MKMIISNDGGPGGDNMAIDSNGGDNMSIIRNERKPERNPPNNNWISGPMHDMDIALKEIQKEPKIGTGEEKKSDNGPTTPSSSSFNMDNMAGIAKALEPLEKRFKEYDDQMKFQRDFIRPTESYSNHYDTGITRYYNNNFEPYMPKPEPAHTGFIVGRAFGGLIGGILVVLLLARVCGKGNRSRRGTALVPRTAVGAATVQQDLETNGGPLAHVDYPRQFATGQTPGAVPPSFDLPPPYSECVNQNVREQSPSYTNPADTQPLVHNDLVEIGFRDDSVAVTTTPNNAKTELVFDNGRIVERLSLDLSKEAEAGQGAKHSDVTDKVVYVDEKSTATRR